MSEPRVLICNLSPIHFVEVPDSPLMKVADEHVYTFEEDGVSYEYSGRQTNQAPVKCILDRAFRGDNKPVTMIVNLYSQECELEHKPYINEDDEEDVRSDENYFIDSIFNYCEEVGIPDPEPERIPYDPANPAASLAELVNLLSQPNAIIDIDTTGGLRDASTLITLAIQAIKERSTKHTRLGEIKLGRIVYSNFKDKTITIQEDTYSLVDLANAIAAFTSYGKADLLCNYFGEHAASDETRALCTELKLFSDRLALCNTKLNKPIRDIHSMLEKLEKTPDTSLMSSEVLLKSLVPTLRSGFVPLNGNLTVSLARWCIERQMLQQALAIIREQVLDAIVEAGIVTLGRGASSKDLEQLCVGKNRKRDSNKSNGYKYKPIINSELIEGDNGKNILQSCLLRPRTMLVESYARIAPNCDEDFSDALICFRYVWLVRNLIMHANESDDTWNCNQLFQVAKKRRIGFEFLKIKRQKSGNKYVYSFNEDAQTADNLTHDLMLVVKVFEELLITDH